MRRMSGTDLADLELEELEVLKDAFRHSSQESLKMLSPEFAGESSPMMKCGLSSSYRRTSSKLRPNPTLNGLSGPGDTLVPLCSSSDTEGPTSFPFPVTSTTLFDGDEESKTSDEAGMKTRGKA